MTSLARSTRRLAGSLALLLAACSPGPEADPQASTKSPPPAEKAVEKAPENAPEPDAASVQTRELTLKPSELSASEGQLEYCLDCMRQASTYTYCHFEEAAFKAAVGDANLDKSVTMRVKMVAKATKNYVPDDPNAPQPDGGFSHEHHDCTVDAVVSVD